MKHSCASPTAGGKHKPSKSNGNACKYVTSVYLQPHFPICAAHCQCLIILKVHDFATLYTPEIGILSINSDAYANHL